MVGRLAAGRSKFVKWVNKQTAVICFDMKRPPHGDDPPARPVARCCIVTLMILAVITSIATISSMQPQTTTQRIFNKDYMVAKMRNSSMGHLGFLCPCHNGVIKWTNFTNFSFLERHPLSSSSPLGLRTVSNSSASSFCDFLGWNDPTPCMTLFDSCCGLDPFDAVLQTPDLMDPTTFAKTFGQLLQEKCTSQERYFFLQLMWKKTSNKSFEKDSELEKLLSRSLLAMARAYLESPDDSSNNYFWEAPSRYYSSESTLAQKYNTAFKMEPNWTKYMTMCNPPYCDEVTPVTTSHKLQQSLAQVGGTIAIMIVLVRTLIWPAIMRIRGWKHVEEDRTAPSSPRPSNF